MFEFQILAKEKKLKARVGEFSTSHGKILTPELAFVATEGELKSIPKEILPKLPVNLIIVNTFHLWVKGIVDKLQSHPFPDRSGREKILATIHDYANFQKPIMSDSGGFQVFSLGFGKAHKVGKVASMFPNENKKDKGLLILRDHDNLIHITEKGVMFNYDKKWFLFTPEMSINIQKDIGADIIFAFDECTSPLNSHTYTKQAMERTHRWLMRCIKENQALFAVVQGGYFEDLRKESARFMGKQNVPGFGIGGTLGRSKEDMHNVIDWTIPYLPEEKPRHLLGIGQVRDIFEAVERGVDLFDCVIPTREARHKVLYTNHGRINLRKMKNVKEVIDKNCDCVTCKEKMTLYKLYELYKLHDPRAFYFATVHNVQFYADLMKKIREAIAGGKFLELKEKVLTFY